MSPAHGPIARAAEALEAGFDRVFEPRTNPLRMLGALAWFFFWIVVVSGIYLYVFFDSGVEQAYASVERLTHAQWYAGGIMRSLHRYASDAMVLVVVAHVLRELLHGRCSGVRAFTWVTGVPLLWLLFAAGITGYWVVWDRLAQFVAIATTEWLDTLPLFGGTIARNFLHSDALSGRFFTLLVFVHIAVPLALLFGMWVHIQRLAQPRVNPPRRVALSLLAALGVASLVRPALSQGPADLDTAVSAIGLDWFYLGFYPLVERYPGEWLWLAAFGTTVLLLVVPWLVPNRQAGIAEVNLENCNGCGRCFDDCPYGAIAMVPRSDGAAFEREAAVLDARCVNCGICVGACPTATPFRRRSAFSPGIDLRSLPLEDVRERLLAACATLTSGRPRILAVTCDHAPRGDLPDESTAELRLNCVGMLPPSFVDFVLSRGHADGVLLAGCAADACEYRLGIRWTEERLARTRDPRLRARVPAARVETCWAGAAGAARLRTALHAFRERLAALAGAADDAAPN